MQTNVSSLIVDISLPFTGAGSAVVDPVASCSVFIASIAKLFSYEWYSKLQMRYTKLRDWINMAVKLYEKISKMSNIAKQFVEKEGQELKQDTQPLS